jgi:hypothetical protein
MANNLENRKEFAGLVFDSKFIFEGDDIYIIESDRGMMIYDAIALYMNLDLYIDICRNRRRLHGLEEDDYAKYILDSTKGKRLHEMEFEVVSFAYASIGEGGVLCLHGDTLLIEKIFSIFDEKKIMMEMFGSYQNVFYFWKAKQYFNL